MTLKPSKSCFMSLGLAALAVIAIACDSGPTPQPQIEANRLETATKLRSYFDKVNGDYSKLSADDKAAFAKLAGGEAKAEQVFNGMKSGPRSAAKPPASGG